MSTTKKNSIGISGIVAGLLFTVLVSFQLYRVQEYSIDQDFAAQIKSHARSIQREMDLNAEVLYSLKELFDSSEEATAKEFAGASNAGLIRHDDILSFEWISRTGSEARTTVENQLREREPHAEFTELDPSERMHKAGARETYYPVVYVEPYSKYAEFLGFDHASEAHRADLIARTRDGAVLTMSPKVKSLHQSDMTEIVLIALPIYRGPTTTIGQRRKSFQGVVQARIDLGRLVRTELSMAARWVYTYELVDDTNEAIPVTLLGSGALTEGGRFVEPIGTIGGRTWAIRADIDPEIYLQRKAFMPLLILIAGTSLFFILAFTLFHSNRQRKLIEAQVIERTRSLDEANKKLSMLSTTDDLTNLQNRRSAFSNLNREWQRHIREKRSLSVMMIDIDYFKAYNDTYGHLAGDQCLKSVADILGAEISRPADVIARYGGEEFIAILPNTDEESQALAERCCKSVENLRIPHEDSPVSNHVTISIGIATTRPDDTIKAADLIDKADRALYAAKSQGRNRVCKEI